MITETGVLEFVGEIIPISDKFQKRDVSIKQTLPGRTGPYDNFIKFQLVQEKVVFIDQFKLGDTITVSLDLKGRKVVKDGLTNYYTNIEAWKIQAAQVAAPVTQTQAPSEPVPKDPPAGGVSPAANSQVPPSSGAAGDGEDNGPDDLPF